MYLLIVVYISNSDSKEEGVTFSPGEGVSFGSHKSMLSVSQNEK